MQKLRFPASITLLVLGSCSWAQNATMPLSFYETIQRADQPSAFQSLKFSGGTGQPYAVRIHSPQLAPLIRAEYKKDELESLKKILRPSLEYGLDARALVRAAERVDENQQDETNYDAVWLRDSLWVYLGLQAAPFEETKKRDQADAKRLLLTLSEYLSSVDQLRRFENAIANPKLVEQDPMNAVHIRFDRRSETFQDVQDQGKPQIWNHKQNDALGLFLDLFARAAIDGSIDLKTLTAGQKKLFSLMPRYFEALRFYEMEDAGSWEEIARINTSSISLVTSALERLQELRSKRKDFRDLMPSEQSIFALINKGYETIFKQLELGGESPQYDRKSAKYRTSDAALLNLIYPAKLSRLKKEHFDQILFIVRPLIGNIGIKRYLKDSYQSGNFWFNQWDGVESDAAKTDDTSSDQNFENRGQQFIVDSEAQWFFDSWLAIALNRLAKDFKHAEAKADQYQFFNRALGQVTGGTASQPVLAGDGKPVRPLAFTESYNTLLDRQTGKRVQVPSPITPLNWAKATMRIAIAELSEK